MRSLALFVQLRLTINKESITIIRKSMRKLMFVLALAGLSTVAMAQQTTEIPTDKYSVATNRFGANWFVSVGGDYTAYYSNQESGVGSYSPFKSLRRAWGADIAVGKWFTPGLGLRLKGQGIWGQQVNDAFDHPEFKQWNAQVQALFNLNNLFCGYKPRVWNISPYVGAGWMRNCSDNCYSMIFGVGLLNQFNLTKRVHINLDIYAQVGEDDLDGEPNGATKARSFFKARDRQVGASLGLGFNLGKVGWEKTPDVDAIMALNKSQVDALNASLADQQAENARLKALLAKQPKETKVQTVKEMASTSASVFFNLNSSKIASKKDLVNVQEIADYAKANGSKILVTGYADSKTGSAAYNAKLSESRAQTVADKLVEMGVSRDQLIVEGKGGVNDLAPYSYNRRVTVKLQ